MSFNNSSPLLSSMQQDQDLGNGTVPQQQMFMAASAQPNTSFNLPVNSSGQQGLLGGGLGASAAGTQGLPMNFSSSGAAASLLNPELARLLAAVQMQPGNSNGRQDSCTQQTQPQHQQMNSTEGLLALAKSIPGFNFPVLNGGPSNQGTNPLDLLRGLQQLTHSMQSQQQPMAQQQQPMLQQGNSPRLDPAVPVPSFSADGPDQQERVDQQKMSLAGQPSTVNRQNKVTSDPAREDVTAGNIPDTIILPCRARGMPVDHNFRTAHFVIPANVAHGEDLICSYAQCRNSGIKFRYCSSCRVPVAKRNFHQRHNHGLKTPPERKQSISLPINNTNNTASKNPASSKVIARPNAPELALERSAPVANVSEGATSLSSGGITLHRQLRWATLLGKRPDSGDADRMSAWLLEVMAVSDPNTSLKQTVTSSLTASASSNEFSGDTREATSSVTSLSSETSEDDKKKEKRRRSKSRERRRSTNNTDNNNGPVVEIVGPSTKSSRPSSEPDAPDFPPQNQGEKRKRDVEQKKKLRKQKLKKQREVDPSPESEGLSASYAEWRDRKMRKAMKSKSAAARSNNNVSADSPVPKSSKNDVVVEL